MSRSAFPLLVLLSLVALVVLGCSDDPVTQKDPVDDSGLVRGEVNPDVGEFSFTVATADGATGALSGPFVIHGRNIHYDEGLGALVADLSVVNHSRASFPEPVGLTFLSLRPEGVEVLNPDNNVHGDGAAIVFEFANDDLLWTPGEESFPRPVHFKTERGGAVAFTARIDIGLPIEGGSIGGIVWHDANRDGAIDPGEGGIGGVEIFMTRENEEGSTIPEILYRTLTDRDGMYRFDRLRAGFYTVTKAYNPRLEPTTPTVIQVILVEENGQVSDFLAANFGCVVREPPPPDSTLVEVGDWIHSTGEYWIPGPDEYGRPRLRAERFEVKDCARPTDLITVDDCSQLPIVLAGPVTQIEPDKRRIQVMDTWLVVPPDSLVISMEIRGMIDLEDIEIGDRVRAVIDFRPMSFGPLGPIVRELFWWEREYDEVTGFVRWVEHSPSGVPVRVRVLDTLVEITNLAVVRP